MTGDANRLRRRVVIIDDDPDDLLLLRRTAVRTGVADAIFTFEDPAEAIEYLAAFACTPGPACDSRIVVLCDLRMPAMDGFAVLQWIRAREFSARVSVVIISGCALDSDVDQARKLGADGYVEKMPSAETLRSSLEAPTFPTTGSRPRRFQSWELAQPKVGAP